MPKKRFKAEQIVVLQRQIEVLMSQGKAAAGGLSGSRNIAAELLSLAEGVRPGDPRSGSEPADTVVFIPLVQNIRQVSWPASKPVTQIRRRGGFREDHFKGGRPKKNRARLKK